jgi:hypothetical protein
MRLAQPFYRFTTILRPLLHLLIEATRPKLIGKRDGVSVQPYPLFLLPALDFCFQH